MYHAAVKGYPNVPVFSLDAFNESLLHSENPIKKVFAPAVSLSKKLSIPCPDFAFVAFKGLQEQNSYKNFVERAEVFLSGEVIPETNHLILLPARLTEVAEPEIVLGVIAHELRILWQKLYRPSFTLHPVEGYPNLLYHPSEIDADAFALYSLMLEGMDVNTAGKLLCSHIREMNEVPYSLRIKKAEAMMKSEKYFTL